MGRKGGKRKIHLIKWEEVVKAKSKGGLGIAPMLVRNLALLCKWSWRFGKEIALWTRILTNQIWIGRQVKMGLRGEH